MDAGEATIRVTVSVEPPMHEGGAVVVRVTTEPKVLEPMRAELERDLDCVRASLVTGEYAVTMNAWDGLKVAGNHQSSCGAIASRLLLPLCHLLVLFQQAIIAYLRDDEKVIQECRANLYERIRQCGLESEFRPGRIRCVVGTDTQLVRPMSMMEVADLRRQVLLPGIPAQRRAMIQKRIDRTVALIASMTGPGCGPDADELTLCIGISDGLAFEAWLLETLSTMMTRLVPEIERRVAFQLSEALTSEARTMHSVAADLRREFRMVG